MIIKTADFRSIKKFYPFYQKVVDQVWQRKYFNFILVHEIISHLAQMTSVEMVFSFHALNFCDSTSSISD